MVTEIAKEAPVKMKKLFAFMYNTLQETTT
jgi:hypothetical protein